MESSSESEAVSDAGTDSTYCPDLDVRSFSPTTRTQPQRTAKMRSYIMVRRRLRNCPLSQMQKRLCDANYLIKDDLSGGRDLNVHQAISLFNELEQIQQNSMKLEEKSKKEVFINCNHLKHISTGKYAKVLSEVSKNSNLQLSSISNQLHSTVMSELVPDSNKASPNIIPSSGNVYYNESNSENFKENYQSLAKRHIKIKRAVHKSREEVSKTFAQEMKNLQQSTTNYEPSSTGLVHNQNQQKSSFYEQYKLDNNNNKGKLKTTCKRKTLRNSPEIEVSTLDRINEKRENSDTFVMCPDFTIKNLNKEPTNASQSELQIEHNENELKVSSFPQSKEISNIPQGTVEKDSVQSIPNSLDAKYMLIPEGTTNCKSHHIIHNTVDTNQNTNIPPQRIITQPFLLLPSYKDFREMSLEAIIKTIEKLKTESYKVFNPSDEFQYLTQEHSEISDKDPVFNPKREVLKNIYRLTDKHLFRIAAKIKVPYEDLKRTVESVVHSQSDESSEESASIISASQSPVEIRYS